MLVRAWKTTATGDVITHTMRMSDMEYEYSNIRNRKSGCLLKENEPKAQTLVSI